LTSPVVPPFVFDRVIFNLLERAAPLQATTLAVALVGICGKARKDATNGLGQLHPMRVAGKIKV
jgi:hypothetical protein